MKLKMGVVLNYSHFFVGPIGAIWVIGIMRISGIPKSLICYCSYYSYSTYSLISLNSLISLSSYPIKRSKIQHTAKLILAAPFIKPNDLPIRSGCSGVYGQISVCVWFPHFTSAVPRTHPPPRRGLGGGSGLELPSTEGRCRGGN